MSKLRERLQEAAATGEVIFLIYHGGSQPGTLRDVSPLRVTEREMRARELATGIVKTFLLEKSEIADSASAVPRYDSEKATAEDEPDSVREACEDDTAALEELGWHVQLSETEITLHRCFKNGKPRKGADVGLSKYEDNPSRPYYVFGPGLAQARTFGRFSSAIQLFAEQAVNHAPKRAT